MSAHKGIDKICVIVLVLTLVIAAVFCNGQALGIEAAADLIGYENRIFDNSKVHTFDIVIDDWNAFLETCENEVYTNCNVIIDGEAVRNVGIRGKGNTSLSSVKTSGSSRYSFKIEFDQYDSTKTYHGLDKLCLNNIIQDTTYMKDYLAYTLMSEFGVDAPLCSFAYITVNGEDWGLYLAVEAIEDSFLRRNYGNDYGDLYKPDSLSFGGGGPGNGKGFNMTDFFKENFGGDESTENTDSTDSSESGGRSDAAPDTSGNTSGGMPNFGGNMPDFGSGEMPDFGNMPGFGSESTDTENDGNSSDSKRPERGGNGGGFGGFGGFGMGSDDVKLKYIDDDSDSYSNIFDSAKTDVTKADKNRLINALKNLTDQTDLENTVDVDEVIRYFVVHCFLCNGDSYTGSMIHNYYLYEDEGKLSMIPWDYNLAYGTFLGSDASGTVNTPIDTPVSGGMSDRPMISWIFDSEEYTELYHQLYNEFLNSFDFAKMIDDTAALIDSYVQKDPTKFCTYEEHLKGVEAMKSYCTLRAESVKGQLDGTIPSTTEGQQADSSALIDTGDLTLSDMGSMGGGGGGGFGGFGRGGESGDSGDRKGSRSSRGSRTSADTATDSENSESDSGEGSGNTETSEPADGNMPDGFDPSKMSGGEMPEGFDPSKMSGGNMPEGFDPSKMSGGEMPEGFDPSKMFGGGMPGGSGDSTGATETDTQSGNAAPSDKTGSSDSRPQMNNFPQMSGFGSKSDTMAYILLGGSALFLLLGIIFAAVFKK
ncbi:MAG: CotH kinase family protein [Ruminiclostridium sp.]|nr:CotH kinase family protein [Ruminiclostridium sp.]